MKKETIMVTDWCIACQYEGDDFKAYPKSGFVVCPNCGYREKRLRRIRVKQSSLEK